MVQPTYITNTNLYNYSINRTITEKDDLTVNITYYSDTRDVVPVLTYSKYGITQVKGSEQKSQDIIGTREYVLTLQDQKVAGLYVFRRILTKQDFDGTGDYVGLITVKQHYEDSTNPDIPNPILQIVPMNVTIEANPLDVYTEFKTTNGNVRMTVRDLIITSSATSILSPRFVYKNKKGKYVAEYSPAGTTDYIQVFQHNGTYLPKGSTYTVIDAKGGKVMARYDRNPGVLRTDSTGKDIYTGNQISSDGRPVSYVVVTDLPEGEYKIYAEFVEYVNDDLGNVKVMGRQTPYADFKITYNMF